MNTVVEVRRRRTAQRMAGLMAAAVAVSAVVMVGMAATPSGGRGLVRRHGRW